MANREIVQSGGGAGIYPLTGDVLSTAGNSQVRVVGLRGTPLSSSFPSAGAVLQYNQNLNTWQPILVASIQVNGITLSTDYEISVNQTKPVLVNGV